MRNAELARVAHRPTRALSPRSWGATLGREERLRQLAVVLSGAALAVSTAATLVACALALIIPQQLDEGEPLIYGLAARLLQHQALYQPIDRQPFVQVHYTPVYYVAVAVLQQLVGHGFAPGRLLSLLAGLLSALILAYLTATSVRSWWAGGFAILMFLGMAFPGGPAPFLVLERVDLLGIAFSIATIAVLAHGTDRPHLVVAGLLAGLALLTKQSLFAAALAGTIWLATFNRRKAGLFLLTSVLTALGPALALEWSSSGAFWHNVGPDNPSPTALPFGAYLFRELAVIQGVPTLLSLVFVVSARAWRDRRLRLLGVYWLASSISVLGILKVGANHNYWIELAAANAVLGTLCIWSCLGAGRCRLWRLASLVPIGLLAANLAVLLPARFLVDRPADVIPSSWTLNIPQFMGLVRDRATFHEFFELLRDEREPVLAESMDVAVLAGHPVQFEPFAFSMLEHEGRWSSQPLVDDVCAGRIPLLVLSHPIEMDLHPVGLREFPMWPASVMTALRASMQLETAQYGHWLYRPQRSLDADAIAACQSAAASARSPS